MKKILVNLFLLTFLLVSTLSATDRYVRCTSGNNSNDGLSWANAFLTAQACIDASSSGDTCCISDNETCTDGLMTETLFTDDNKDLTFTIKGCDDGGSNSISFPDDRPDIENVAVFDLSADTSGYSIDLRNGQAITLQNLKVTVPDKNQGIYLATAVHVKDSEFNDDGLTSGDKTFFRLQSQQSSFDNVYFKKLITGGLTIYQEANSGYAQDVSNSYIKLGAMNRMFMIGKYATADRSTYKGNVFEVTGSYSGSEGLIEVYGDTLNEIENNTFIGNGLANAKALEVHEEDEPTKSIKNNLFYGFNGAGAKSISFVGTDMRILTYGNNGFFNSNAPDTPPSGVIVTDLTANDVTESANPFTDLSGGNLKLIADYRGTASNGLDIGAKQSGSAGGGGSMQYIMVGE